MLSSAQVEKDVLLEVTSKRSLKKASRIQKCNNLLDQVLAYLHQFDTNNNTNSFLETDKILRVSGSGNQINQVFNKMMGRAKSLSGDPSIKPLKTFDKFIQDPNNIVGLIKYGLNEIKLYWPLSVHNVFQAFVNDSSMTFEDFIRKLMQKGALEEAKVFHNLLHLFHSIYQFRSKNNMQDIDIVKSIAEPLAHFSNHALPFAGAKKLFRQTTKFSPEQLMSGEKRLLEAIRSDSFAKTFAQNFASVNNDLAKSYEDDARFPILTAPMRSFGMVLPGWLSTLLIKYWFKDNPPIAIESEPVNIVEPNKVDITPEPVKEVEPEPVKAVVVEPVKVVVAEPVKVVVAEPVKAVVAEPVKEIIPEPVKQPETFKPMPASEENITDKPKPKAKPKTKAKPKVKNKETDEIVKQPSKDRLSDLQDKFIMMNRPQLKTQKEPKEK